MSVSFLKSKFPSFKDYLLEREFDEAHPVDGVHLLDGARGEFLGAAVRMHLNHVDAVTDFTDSYKLAIAHILCSGVAREPKVSLFAQDRRRSKGVCVEQKAIVLVAAAKDSNHVMVYH